MPLSCIQSEPFLLINAIFVQEYPVTEHVRSCQKKKDPFFIFFLLLIYLQFICLVFYIPFNIIGHIETME